MALEGTLESFGIAEIFQLIGSQAKTGVLEIENADSVSRIRFVNGQMLDAYPGKTEPGLYIGGMLVRAGLVSDTQLEYALGLQKKSLRKLGDILIRMGTIRTNEFQEMLALQRREMAYTLIRLKKGKYRFTPCEVEYEEGVDTLMGVDSILMEGSRQIDEWPNVLKRIPTDTRVYRRKPDSTPMRELNEPEVIVYALLDGVLTVREVIDRSRLGEFNAWDALASLYDEGLIVPVDVAKKRPQKQQAPVFDSTARKRTGTVDSVAGIALVVAAVVLIISPYLVKSAGRISFADALGMARSDIASLGGRIEGLERRIPIIPEKVVQINRAKLHFPTGQN